MTYRLSPTNDVRVAAQTAMVDALAAFPPAGSIIVLSHFDADGLAAAAILVRALRRAGRNAGPLVIGKTASPWDADTRDQLAALEPAGLIVADLGTRPEPVLPGCPTLTSWEVLVLHPSFC